MSALSGLRPSARRAMPFIASWWRAWVEDLLSFVPDQQVQKVAHLLGFEKPVVLQTSGSHQWRLVDTDCEQVISIDGLKQLSRQRLLILRIDETQILRRKLMLPRAAMKNLKAALDVNLSTWTPFSAEEIYAAAHPLSAGSEPAGSAAIELRCVPRALADEQAEELRSLGAEPDALSLGSDRFQIVRPTRKRRLQTLYRWLLAGSGVLLMSQAAGLCALLAVRQADELQALEATRAQLTRGLRLRANAEKQAVLQRAALKTITSAMSEDESFSRAFHLLGKALPADTYVREFESGRNRANGHLVLVGPRDIDVSSALSRTRIFRANEVSVLASADDNQRVFSVGFDKVQPPSIAGAK